MPSRQRYGPGDSWRAEVLAQKVYLHLLARQVELRIRHHVRRRERDHLGLAVDHERGDPRRGRDWACRGRRRNRTAPSRVIASGVGRPRRKL